MNAILMTQEYWISSPFSIARCYGGISVDGKQYVVVNKDGVTLAELSDPGSGHYVGDDRKAIEPGEPADLILKEWLPVYRALGRERTMEVVSKGMSLKEATALVKESGRRRR